MNIILTTQSWSSALFNHLWQSTVILVFAWLLTLALHNNSARIRYSIWMTASLKFLVPFSLLTRLGAYWAKPAAYVPTPAFSFVVEEVTYPFRHAQFAGSTPATLTASSHASPVLWTLILVTWICGFVVLLGKWIYSWGRAATMARKAAPFRGGREFNMLRHAELRARIKKPISLRISATEIEPGIFGVIRPVLLWPAGLSDRLNDLQIEAIMVHEVEHVRRRDNLTAAAHAFVEALFWFHPLVRWMSAKMNEERERACDESVMEQNAVPEVYAESILKVCAFCMEPPTPCISGVSGADLKDRILRIMTGRSGAKLSSQKRAVLYAAAALIVAAPVGFGVLHGQSTSSSAAAPSKPDQSAPSLPKYEIASIKPYKADDGPGMRVMMRITPDGVSLHGVPLRMILQQSFSLEQDRITGEPSWTTSSRYDIEAKVEPEDAPKLKDLKVDQRNAMMLQLLVDRFNLKYHYEKRELPMYALVVAKSGLKIKPSKPDSDPPDSNPPNTGNGPKMGKGMMMMNPGHFESTGTSVEMLAHALSRQLGRTVVDKTGLTGNYDFTLDFTPDNSMMPIHGGPEGGPKPEMPPDQGGPSLFTAVEEQLGLKLESTKATVDVVVIDHIDQPSEN